MIRANKSDVTPLTRQEKEKEALQQYMKLEMMATQKSLPKVRALQDSTIDQKYLPSELQSGGLYMSDSGEPKHLSELPPAHNLILSVDG
jgi:hypothetical protein